MKRVHIVSSSARSLGKSAPKQRPGVQPAHTWMTRRFAIEEVPGRTRAPILCKTKAAEAASRVCPPRCQGEGQRAPQCQCTHRRSKAF
jgi:hypothetical protein